MHPLMIYYSHVVSAPVVPHVTDAIQQWVERVAQITVARNEDRKPDVCVIEVSGSLCV